MNKFVIFRMRAYPEPHYCVVYFKSKSPPTYSYANGIYRFPLTDAFKF